MDMDDLIAKPLQNIPLETLFCENYPFCIFNYGIRIEYDQLVKILRLDAETAAKCVSDEPFERALRTWIAMHGEEATIGNFARQLIKHGHRDFLTRFLDSMGIAGTGPSRQDLKSDVYLSGADADFTLAFLDSAEIRHNLKVCVPDRDFFPGHRITENIIHNMIRSRCIILAEPASGAQTRDEEWTRFGEELAVQLCPPLNKDTSAGDQRVIIPVWFKKSSVRPADFQCFESLFKRDEESLDQFCDRICKTIIDFKAGLPNPEEEKTFHASQTCEPLPTSSVENVELGVHLRGDPYLSPQRSQIRGADKAVKHRPDPDQERDTDQEEEGEKDARPSEPLKTGHTGVTRVHPPSLVSCSSSSCRLPRLVSSRSMTSVYTGLVLSEVSNAFRDAAQNAVVAARAAVSWVQRRDHGIMVPRGPVPEARHCDTDGVPQPVFSEDWQFQGSFSTTGGQLRGQNSDVILVIPEHAVRDASQESLSAVADLKCLRKKAASFQVSDCQAWSGAVAHGINNDVVKRGAIITDLDAREINNDVIIRGAIITDLDAREINNDVIIRGAISTDLQRVHEKLHLGRCESVRSPVAEYYAGENFSFQKPVTISLPHFLPPGFSAGDVRVYQFHRDSDGQILVNKLKPLKTEDTSDKHTASNTPGTSAENDVTATEGFYFTDDNRIQVVTSHFSGYLCTLCKKEMDPPHLRLRLYGKHVQRQSRDVDLTLFIWDLRLDIRDFRKAGLPNQEDEQTFLMSQTLEPRPTTSNIENLELGASLYLMEQDSAIWMHWSRNDAPAFPPQRRIGIKKFVPCCLDTIPERVDWALLTRHDPGQLKWFQCMLDVGYVTSASDDVPLQFLPVPRIQTFRIRGLELTNEQRSATTQTNQHLMEDTHVRQLEGNFTSPRTTAEAPSTASSPPFSLPQTASVQGASAYHGQRQYVATASMPASHQGSSGSSDSVSNIAQASFSDGMAFNCSGVTMANQARAASLEEQMSCPEQASLGEGMAAMSLNPGGAAPNFSRAAPVQEQNADTSFNPEGAMLNQTGAGPTQEQMSAMALNPPASALSPSRACHVTRSGGEGDNSTKQVIYTNCTFNMQANKSTTNNNVGKLHDMNFGNTTNIASEGDQAEGGTPHHVTPPHHVTEPRIEFPDVADVLQQSLGQQAENESLQ